ncbi:MAG: GNAT family N-acetyltransferase [Bacteroidia bacterium]|nr:GNAT family N-acetyltransferase [Bacteroidia bacterium]
MLLNYKQATEKDAELVALLATKIWKNYYSSIISMEQIEYMLEKMYSIKSIQQQMKKGQQYTIVYDSNQAAIGYIAISTNDNQNYFLHKFYVDTNEHRKGVGSTLFNHLLKKDLKNAKTIELTVNRQNFKAINFYFKNGFTIKSVADFDIGNGYFMNDFIMIKSNTSVSITK